MKRTIAFFDFDGTITRRDTLLEFIKFSKGTLSFYLGFLFNLPFLIAYKLKLISNHAAKEKILTFFYRNTSILNFEHHCQSFTENVLPKLIRPKAAEEIRRLQKENVTVAVVSASPENWIKKWAMDNGVVLIASRMETSNGKITGKLLGKNCHGKEKVSRIVENYDLSQYEVVAAYGDTPGDLPMLKLAARAFYRPFRSNN